MKQHTSALKESKSVNFSFAFWRDQCPHQPNGFIISPPKFSSANQFLDCRWENLPLIFTDDRKTDRNKVKNNAQHAISNQKVLIYR